MSMVTPMKTPGSESSGDGTGIGVGFAEEEEEGSGDGEREALHELTTRPGTPS